MGGAQSSKSDEQLEKMSPEELTNWKVDTFGPGISSEYTIISENDLPAIAEEVQKRFDDKVDNICIDPPQRMLPPIRFKTHDIYHGLWQYNKMNGHGQMFFANGSYYYGRWENSKPRKGILVYPDGETYEGKFKEGKAHGKGKYTYSNGWIYDGKWKEDKMDGHGRIFYLSEKKDSQNQDKIISQEITVYAGQFKDGLKHGKGTLAILNKFTYEGDFERDQMNGEGKLTLPNNKTYKGKFENNKMSGVGTFKWGQTVEYKGNYLNYQKSGIGSYRVGNTEYQCDDFVNGKLDKRVIVKNLKDNTISDYLYFKNGTKIDNHQNEEQQNKQIQQFFAGDLENVFQ